MKYESSILKRLIDTYGVIGNPRYLSEIIKEFIVRGKELYPQLFTYQSDWLAHIDEFGLTPEYTVSYTGQHIYAPNTKEKPVKSAILKGNTLVNIFDNWANNVGTLTPVKTQDGYFLFTGDNKNARVNLDDIPLFKRGVEYTFIYRIKNSTYDGKNSNILRLDVGATTIYAHNVTNGIWKIKKSFSTDETNCFVKVVSWVSSTGSAEVSLQIIEGDYTNVDIPYFEGMQSVEMPVLTTTGENVFSQEITDNGVLYYDSGVVGYHDKRYWTTDFIEIEPNKNYSFMMGGDSRYCLYDENKTYITGRISRSFNTSEARYVKISGTSQNLMLVYGTEVPEIYKPFKSNILTVNEDVTLRGVGDVKDELNLLTGELTQRIGEVVLDGSEDETWNNTLGNHYVDQETKAMCLPKSFIELPVVNTGKTNTMVNNFKVLNTGYTNGQGYGVMAISTHDTWHIQFVKQGVKTVEKWREFLQSNPIKIKYQLTTESVKTVDLTIHDKDHQKVERLTSFEGGTHFTTSSQDGSLLPTLTVDVVTDLEETLMVCSLEGNTM